MLASMRVRIRRVPTEREVDGVQLDGLIPGFVREFSASVASWLITKGYAESEMRAPQRETYSSEDRPRESANHQPTPRRRRDDR
jgi:hypothetical protein